MSSPLQNDIKYYGLDFELRKRKGKRGTTPVESGLEGYNPYTDPTVFFPQIPSPEPKSKKKTVQIEMEEKENEDDEEKVKTYIQYYRPEGYEKEIPTKGKDDALLESLADIIYTESGIFYGPVPTGEELVTSMNTLENSDYLGKDPDQLNRVRERKKRKKKERKTLGRGRGRKKHKTHRKNTPYKKSKKNRKSKKSKKNR